MRGWVGRVVGGGLALGAVAGTPAVAQQQSVLFLAEDVPTSLNYDGPAASIGTTQTGFINLMEPMVYYPYAGTGEDGVRLLDFTRYEGRLVERWEYDAASLTWTMHLRRGVRSCAGNEFTAEDVLYTFARAKSVSGKAPVAWFLANVGGVKGFTRDVFKDPEAKKLGDEVTKVDDYTVRITQSAPNAFLLMAMTIYGMAPFDSKEMKAHAKPDDPWSHDYVNTENVPAFGPYCLERWVKDDEFVVKANPNYYRGKPAVERVVMKKIPQSANRLVTLRSGRAQLTQRLTAKEFASLRNTSGVKVVGVYGNETLFLAPNWKVPPFDNVKLRQAMAYAVNYGQAADIGYAGAAKRWESHIPSSFPGYARPDQQYAYDPEKAKALLAEAGYPGGKGLEAFADQFKLAYTAERESYLGPIAAVIQTSLKAVGFPVVLDPIPQTQIGDRRLVKKDLPLSISDTDKASAISGAYQLMVFYISNGAGAIINTSNYANPEVDGLFAKIKAETDQTKQTEMLKAVQDILQRDLAIIPILETKTQYATSAKLSGVTWHADNSIRFFDLSLVP
ncbi:MAG: ABC transporter substrate-binding protein [Methylobacteriaceae bacterium]|nr:ABC transporter substrate-binding protein [Methylobacteriaceae bacterium]